MKRTIGTTDRPLDVPSDGTGEGTKGHFWHAAVMAYDSGLRSFPSLSSQHRLEAVLAAGSLRRPWWVCGGVRIDRYRSRCDEADRNRLSRSRRRVACVAIVPESPQQASRTHNRCAARRHWRLLGRSGWWRLGSNRHDRVARIWWDSPVRRWHRQYK